MADEVKKRLRKKKPEGRGEVGEINLTAKSIVDLMEKDPSLSLADASEQVTGFSFKQLISADRRAIMDQVSGFVNQFYLAPEVRRELVRAVENAGVLKALEMGNLGAALDFTDRVSLDPATELRGKQQGETVISLEGLEKALSAIGEKVNIVDITAEKKEDNKS